MVSNLGVWVVQSLGGSEFGSLGLCFRVGAQVVGILS